jgi:hypothetical protein
MRDTKKLLEERAQARMYHLCMMGIWQAARRYSEAEKKRYKVESPKWWELVTLQHYAADQAYRNARAELPMWDSGLLGTNIFVREGDDGGFEVIACRSGEKAEHSIFATYEEAREFAAQKVRTKYHSGSCIRDFIKEQLDRPHKDVRRARGGDEGSVAC